MAILVVKWQGGGRNGGYLWQKCVGGGWTGFSLTSNKTKQKHFARAAPRKILPSCLDAVQFRGAIVPESTRCWGTAEVGRQPNCVVGTTYHQGNIYLEITTPKHYLPYLDFIRVPQKYCVTLQCRLLVMRILLLLFKMIPIIGNTQLYKVALRHALR